MSHDAGRSIRSTARFVAHVTLRWEKDALSVRRVRLGERLCLSELGWKGAVVEPRVGSVRVHVPEGCAAVQRTATVEVGVEGPAAADLGAGDAIEMRAGAFAVVIEADRESELVMATSRTAGASVAPLAHVLAAAVLHGVFLFAPASSALAASVEDGDDRGTERMRTALASAEARSLALDATIQDGQGKGQGKLVNERDGNGRAGGGHRASGEEGRMGSAISRSREARRWAAPARIEKDRSPAVSREEAKADAASFGMIGLLSQGPRAPVSPWGDVETHGLDQNRAANGAMWAASIGESAGAAGLGLAGVGEGGGGDGLGIGLGTIGTIGHTSGEPGSGTGGRGSPMHGFGVGWGGSSWGRHGFRSHYTRAPKLRMGLTVVDGTLPPEVIQRIVRQNFGRFRYCYEKGLAHNPSLEGRVATRFLIGGDGRVKASSDAGSSLPDAGVVACVVTAFQGLTFPEPAPAGSVVTVTYPLLLSPE